MNDDKKPEILKWRSGNKDHKLYRCRMCAFDSLDKAKFEDHFAKAHPPVRVIDGGKGVKPDAPATDSNKEG